MIVSKHDVPENEKCPNCLQIHVNFAEVDDYMIGCLRCGSVFIKKERRQYLFDNQVEILRDKDKVVDLLLCSCGFRAKSAAGLAVHKKKCSGRVVDDYLSEALNEPGSSGN